MGWEQYDYWKNSKSVYPFSMLLYDIIIYKSKLTLEYDDIKNVLVNILLIWWKCVHLYIFIY